MPIYDLRCSNDHEQYNLYLKLGERPPCPVCGKATETLWTASANVIGDDIPGGIEIRHGLVNEDGSPQKFYTKSAIIKEATRRGLTQNMSGNPDRKVNKRPVHFVLGK